SQRLGLTDLEKPEKIEYDLMELVPQNEWIFFGPAVVLHGRYTCTSAAPKCPSCVLEDLCEKRGVADGGAGRSGAEDEDEEEDDSMPARKKPAARKASGGKSKASAAPASPARAGSTATSGGSAMKVSDIPESWRNVLADEFEKPYFQKLKDF